MSAAATGMAKSTLAALNQADLGQAVQTGWVRHGANMGLHWTRDHSCHQGCTGPPLGCLRCVQD